MQSDPPGKNPDKAIESHTTLLGSETSILREYVGQAFDTVILSGDPDKSAWRHTFKGVQVTKWFIPRALETGFIPGFWKFVR